MYLTYYICYLRRSVMAATNCVHGRGISFGTSAASSSAGRVIFYAAFSCKVAMWS